ncbi:MAG: glycine cleavage system aminomethyltransferase GcvT [Deltaproteobacteria bacterium]|nr:MAG: glycine cleavage system aminomethyltransferase GcvT [Deltaproteobacteria bacterium]
MSDPASLRRTPFHHFHVEAGARMVDFGGWHMPIQYTGIRQEHRACRASLGLFDVSHMGEIRVRGPRALEAVRGLVTNDLDIAVGQARYSPMCRPDGGIVDDLIVYRLADDDVMICVNAANRAKDFAWVTEHNPLPGAVTFEDEGDAWAQVAVQGRNAEAALQKLTDVDLSAIRYYWLARGSVAGVDGCIIARTGYTGEDGFEVFLPVEGADTIWPAIVEAGRGFPEGDLQLVGLGARDTLRLEARMCLYGNDIDETTTPLEAGLGWAVKLDGPDFIGKQALVEQKAAGLTRRLVGLVVERRIPRPHCRILADGQDVGEVTSGTKSPSLDTGIALGYVARRFARPGTALQVDVRGKPADAVVHKGAFYTRPY